jgi:hypothetical protein
MKRLFKKRQNVIIKLIQDQASLTLRDGIPQILHGETGS